MAILAAMAKAADLDQLAEQFVDLWRDQMAAMAGDPELARLLKRMLGLWGLGPFDATPFAVAPEATPGATPQQDAPVNGHTAAPPGSETARAASGDARAFLVEFGRRLEAMEERLARLEARRPRRRPSPRPKPRRRKSR